MNKMSAEFKKMYQVGSPSPESTTEIISGYALSGIRVCRGTVVRCSQFFGATLLAGGFYLLNLWAGDGVRLLVALSAISAMVYIGLAMQSRTMTMTLLNLLATPILFVTAFAGMNVVAEWLTLSFILHGCVAAVQFSSIDTRVKGGLFCWSVFNSSMALFLLLS